MTDKKAPQADFKELHDRQDFLQKIHAKVVKAPKQDKPKSTEGAKHK